MNSPFDFYEYMTTKFWTKTKISIWINIILEKDFFESISLEELHPDPTPAPDSNEISPQADPGLWIPEFIPSENSENSEKDHEADGLKKKIDHFMKN